MAERCRPPRSSSDLLVNGLESARSGALGLDLGDDIGRVKLSDDLFGDLATMHVDLAGEIECDAHTVSLDACDSHDPDRRLRVTDHDFFTLAPRDDQHLDLLSKPTASATERRYH
jgi:hypothetical protein